MEMEQQRIKQRIEDYSRFFITLIVLSVYFYLGMIITNYLEPSDKGILLVWLLLLSLISSGVFLYLVIKWKKQLSDLLQD
ncbi:YrhC family protein [Aquibacillus salsiterrae]|uniref:YrhC family protein n=1 Tax=Aquibacillus salsiterrae TaxID=2950439 RepID=A0A9X3WBG5_9BACI|nr:YrhC family protein [Aquibacillus salsiterrae]MDC3415603.1 YrhC family protein [Aquibacillus salsiterrae]